MGLVLVVPVACLHHFDFNVAPPPVGIFAESKAGLYFLYGATELPEGLTEKYQEFCFDSK